MRLRSVDESEHILLEHDAYIYNSKRGTGNILIPYHDMTKLFVGVQSDD